MLMTQHVSAGLARAWRAEAAQRGLPAAAPADPRGPSARRRDRHLMSQQLGPARPPADPAPARPRPSLAPPAGRRCRSAARHPLSASPSPGPPHPAAVTRLWVLAGGQIETRAATGREAHPRPGPAAPLALPRRPGPGPAHSPHCGPGRAGAGPRGAGPARGVRAGAGGAGRLRGPSRVHWEGRAGPGSGSAAAAAAAPQTSHDVWSRGLHS